ncbi:hypothetical protein PIB30_001337 [Stylosanthes scabra]|uniref:RNase III domain-containing protein n=1 Tax=Stylosanthes scabra TaxID=79078 RepID=A0ABU6Y2U3_9FABA|nr:hypothetical protein [Stylosanthes scabra]
MNWIGIKVDTNIIPYEIHLSIPPEKLVNVTLLESLLNYTFQEPSLLVVALTDSSYNCKENYQRLEFLGDAVLDYLISQYFYKEYHDESCGLLTVMRTISVTNVCFALSAIRAKLHEHIIHNSKDLDKRIAATVNEVEKLSVKSTFGWELDTSFPNVLADVIESLAGAIYVDSGYSKEVVFQSIRPLLEPLVTPETARLLPLGELHELCQRKNSRRKKSQKVCADGVTSISTAVKAKDEKTAEKVASKEVLKLLKDKNVGEDTINEVQSQQPEPASNAHPSMRLTDLPLLRCSFGYYVLWEFLHYIESTPLRVVLEDGRARFLGFVGALSMFPFDITWLDSYNIQIVSPPEDAPSRALKKTLNEIEVIDQELATLLAKKADLQERASELNSILDSPYSVFK